uniref:Uncharacterized protein n=1 Tax=viral metagenome TaxID=1070528 RepID=A0A6C0K4H5_9ZZZZ
MRVKTWYPFPETFNKDLCVLPTDGESQYEAFQSIFAKIMSATFGSEKKVTTNVSPYEMLCEKFGIELIFSNTTPDVVGPEKRIIWYAPGKVTHYIANVNGKEMNPYDKLQAVNTQGFCQMFAFFLAKGDTVGFKNVEQSKMISLENFNILVHNTQTCLKKSLTYIEDDPKILERFGEFFQKVKKASREQLGIKKGISFEEYIRDFKKINESENCVKAYIYDNPLRGYSDGKPRLPLWFLPEHKAPNYSEQPYSYDYPKAAPRASRSRSRSRSRRAVFSENHRAPGASRRR